MKKRSLNFIAGAVAIGWVLFAGWTMGCSDDHPSSQGNDGDLETDGDVDANLTWVSIPEGIFWMGCVSDDTSCKSDESPRHHVTLSAFQMTETEVTQDQYSEVIGNNPSYFKACGGNCPVEQVEWDDARYFCEKVGGRLPTEAEYEYAARAGTDTIFICGTDVSCLDGSAWYYENSSDTAYPSGTTHAVGQKTANAFGLYDMSGNVWEWCADWYSSTYYSSESVTDPTGPASGSHRVLRGGSWQDNGGWNLRASDRVGVGLPPGRYSSIGFRCARD